MFWANIINMFWFIVQNKDKWYWVKKKNKSNYGHLYILQRSYGDTRFFLFFSASKKKKLDKEKFFLNFFKIIYLLNFINSFNFKKWVIPDPHPLPPGGDNAQEVACDPQ